MRGEASAAARFRVLVSPPAPGGWNMALDAALLDDAARGGRPWLRLYAFEPRTITLGRAEHAPALLDLARCAVDGVGVARRPTGGRAVLHADELTYCLAVADGEAVVGTGGEALGRFAGEMLAAALGLLGVPAETVRTSSAAAPRVGYRSCFASASRWEVAVGGRKIVGSAQRRFPGAVLQHGSILLGPGFRALGRYLNAATARPGAGEDLARATAASEVLGRPVTREEAVEAVLRALTARAGPVERCASVPAPVRAAAEVALAASGDPVWAVRGAPGRVDTLSGAFLYSAPHTSG